MISSSSPIPSPLPAFVSQQVTTARRFYLNLNPARSAGLSVVCGGVETCAPDYVVRRPTFPFYCIEFVAAGRGEVTLNNMKHPLGTGMLFCYGPGIRHEINTAHDAPMEKYFLDFAGRKAGDLLRDCGLEAGAARQVSAVGDVRSAFDLLVSLGEHQDPRTPRMCALQLELLLHTIARSGSANSVAERRSRAAFERCRQHIDTHFIALRSLADVAEACHLGASHLCRLFKRFHRESPTRYLQRRRMHWAADRLQAPGQLVREVADELGLDAFQFSRTFKRIHGVSPLAFLATRA